MPITTTKYNCRSCGEFTATSEEWVKCECGKCEVKPAKHSSSYRGEKHFDSVESETFYFEDDFLILDDDLIKLYNEAKVKAEALGFHVWENLEKGKDEKYLNSIHFSKTEFVNDYKSEFNEIVLNIYLGREYRNPIKESIESRLITFIEFLKETDSGEIELRKRTKLLEYAEERDLHWSSRQSDEYDYTFNF